MQSDRNFSLRFPKAAPTPSLEVVFDPPHLRDSPKPHRISAPEQCPLCRVEAEQCIRCQAYDRLPRWSWSQHLLTFTMGVPHVNQQPLIVLAPLGRFALTYSLLIFFSYLPCVFFPIGLHLDLHFLPLLLILSSGLIPINTGLFRSMHHFLLHHASHRSFGRHSAGIGTLACMTAATQAFEGYSRQHRVHHQRPASDDDDEIKIMALLGLTTSHSPAQHIKVLNRALVSPSLFLKHTKERWNLGSSARAPTPMFQCSILISLILVSYLIHTSLPLLFWVVLWAVPLTYGYYVSSILYSVGLHCWYHGSDIRSRNDILRVTKARFFGDPCPAAFYGSAKRGFLWTAWWVRFVIVHFYISRLAIVGPTDNMQHDAHHAFGRNEFDWCQSAYSRHQLLSRGSCNGAFVESSSGYLSRCGSD
jgi:hypothetical protein